jgi:hypothetical protein
MRCSLSRSAATFLLAVGVLSCTDASPAPRAAHAARLAFLPQFSANAAAIFQSLSSFALDVDNVRITIRSVTGTGDGIGEVLKDTTVAFPSDVNEITVEIDLELPAREQAVVALVQLRVGSIVFFEGGQELLARQGETAGDPEPVPMTYVGPGVAAEFLSLNLSQPTLAPSATLQFTATAYDHLERRVADLPIAWSTSDASIATISETGLVTSTGKNGTATITAKGLNGISQQATLIVQPVARLVLVQGDKLVGLAGASLSEPFTVQAVATSGQPVIGAAIAFRSATAGGVVDPANAITDLNGMAAATMRLGQLAGAYTFEAQASGLPNVPTVSVNATALAGTAAALIIAAGNNQVDTVRATFAQPLVVKVTDALGNPVAGQNVDWAVMTGAGNVSALINQDVALPPQKTARTTTAADGTTRVTVVVDSIAGAVRVAASLPGTTIAPVVFSITANPGVARQLIVVQQPSPIVQATVRLGQQPKVQVADQFGNPVRANGIVVYASESCRSCGKIGHQVPGAMQPGRAQSTKRAPTTVARTAAVSDTITRGVVGTNPVTTDDNGIASFGDLALNDFAGTSQLVFFDAREALSPAFSDYITVTPGPARSIIAWTGDETFVFPGDTIRPYVRVQDAVGNPIAGVTISWDSKQGTQGTLDNSTSKTDADGLATPGIWRIPSIATQGTVFVILATPEGLSLENAPLPLRATISQLGEAIPRPAVPVGRVASNTTFPPTTVMTIRASRMVSGATVVRSRSIITKSASMPFFSVPLSFSANSAYAASWVYARNACSTEIFCSGIHPPGFLSSSVRRVTAA